MEHKIIYKKYSPSEARMTSSIQLINRQSAYLHGKLEFHNNNYYMPVYSRRHANNFLTVQAFNSHVQI